MRLDTRQIEAIREEIGELPQGRRKRLQEEYAIKTEAAHIFTVNKNLGEYFEKVVSELRQWLKDEKITTSSDKSRTINLAANYLITELQKLVTRYRLSVTSIKITPENFAELIVMIHKGAISSSGAQDILAVMFKSGGDPSHIVDELGLRQVNNEEELEKAAKKVIEANDKAVADYKKGKEESLKFLVGQMMRETKGAANPQVAANILKKILG